LVERAQIKGRPAQTAFDWRIVSARRWGAMCSTCPDRFGAIRLRDLPASPASELVFGDEAIVRW